MAGITFDSFTGRYAQRTAGMTASEIRALFAVASRPEVVSLAGGMPYTTALPLVALVIGLRFGLTIVLGIFESRGGV